MLRFDSRFSSHLLRLFFLLTVASVLASSVANAQESEGSGDETLTGGLPSSGGYGAPTVALTTLNGEIAAMIGAQGGWILNRHLVLGGAVRGIAPRPDVPFRNRSPNDPLSAQLQVGYMGLLVEYIGRPSELLHYGAELVVGGGTIELVDDQTFRAGPTVTDERLDRASAFASEVGARVELNVTSFLRVGVSGGYRFVAGSNLEKANVSNWDLSAPYGQLSLRFGRF